jgi:uncharacterized membrane protein YgcG
MFLRKAEKLKQEFTDSSHAITEEKQRLKEERAQLEHRRVDQVVLHECPCNSF